MFDFIMNILSYLVSIGFMVWGSRMMYLYFNKYVPTVGTCIKTMYDIGGHKRANISYQFKEEEFVAYKSANWMEEGSSCKIKLDPSKPKETITRHECFLYGLMILCGLFLFLAQIGILPV